MLPENQPVPYNTNNTKKDAKGNSVVQSLKQKSCSSQAKPTQPNLMGGGIQNQDKQSFISPPISLSTHLLLLPNLRPQPRILSLQPPILPLQPRNLILPLLNLPLQLPHPIASANRLQYPAQLVVEACVQRFVLRVGLAVQLVELAGFGLGDGERRSEVRVDGGDAGGRAFDLCGKEGFKFEDALGEV